MEACVERRKLLPNDCLIILKLIINSISEENPTPNLILSWDGVI